MQQKYIICLYDDRYEVVGPFDSIDALQAYGEKWQAENEDRPTWQSLRLDDPHAIPVVIAP